TCCPAPLLPAAQRRRPNRAGSSREKRACCGADLRRRSDTPLLRLPPATLLHPGHWTERALTETLPVRPTKVFINGVDETLGAGDQLHRTCKEACWCQDYSSSDTTVASSPQAQATACRHVARLPARRAAASRLRQRRRPGRLAGAVPDGGVKLKQFRLICKLAATRPGDPRSRPAAPETREAEVTGCARAPTTCSWRCSCTAPRWLAVRGPDSAATLTRPADGHSVGGRPESSAATRGHCLCRLVNRRDRHVRRSTHPTCCRQRRWRRHSCWRSTRRPYQSDHGLPGDCFKSLEALHWRARAAGVLACPQSNQEVPLSGYRVLVDGGKYGSALHQACPACDQAEHRPAQSRSQHGGAVRVPGHTVTGEQRSRGTMAKKAAGSLRDQRLPSFLGKAAPSPQAGAATAGSLLGWAELLLMRWATLESGMRLRLMERGWPKKGCCLYQETLAVERRNFLNYYNPASSTNSCRPRPPTCSSCLAGSAAAAVPARRPEERHAAVLLDPLFFVRLAAELRRQFDFVAIATQRFDNAHERSALQQHCIKELALETDGLTHVYAVDRTMSDVHPEAFHIVGVPFFVAVHSEGYIAWRGRYCALDYSSFEEEMSQVLRSVKDKTRLDDQLSVENGQPATTRTRSEPYDDSNVALHPANSFAGTAGSKKPSKQSPAKISISTRPTAAGRGELRVRSGGGGGVAAAEAPLSEGGARARPSSGLKNRLTSQQCTQDWKNIDTMMREGDWGARAGGANRPEHQKAVRVQSSPIRCPAKDFSPRAAGGDRPPRGDEPVSCSSLAPDARILQEAKR
uniref:Thioredoxin domain-containing protein n=1 Tax=Macrostomum lignano TaxID=282301 RepID=A0A1I8FEG9_9PLAT